MSQKPTIPICTAFLTCRTFGEDSKTKEPHLIGLPSGVTARHFPTAKPLAFFIRCTSAHGIYRVEVQLQSLDGEVLWRDGPIEPLSMIDPLKTYDLKMNCNVSFPKPDVFQFVLLLEGEEVARQRFHVSFREAAAPKKQNDS